MTTLSLEAYRAAPIRFVDAATARIATRSFGAGPAVLLIHGWPFSGFIWRRLIPTLAERFTCITVDLAGAGDSTWERHNDFSFHGHAEHLRRVLEDLEPGDVRVIAHDTGATVARRLAIVANDRVKRLVAIDTEIPNHRPPLVPLLQKVMRLPGSNAVFRGLLRSEGYLRSANGFGGCYVDLANLDADFRAAFIAPLVASARRTEGQMRYAIGIDWSQLDQLAQDHRRIRAPVLLIWGDADPFFPVAEARPMAAQFNDCRGFEVIPNAKLLSFDERPDLVLEKILPFLG